MDFNKRDEKTYRAIGRYKTVVGHVVSRLKTLEAFEGKDGNLKALREYVEKADAEIQAERYAED